MFRVDLQERRFQPIVTSFPDTGDPIMAQRQYKVLLADDIKLELEIEKTFFQRSGFQVLTAADGPKALAMALTEKPDLVILDQVMPGLNGTDVCKLLKARPETGRIPVLITSSLDRPDIKEI